MILLLVVLLFGLSTCPVYGWSCVGSLTSCDTISPTYRCSDGELCSSSGDFCPSSDDYSCSYAGEECKGSTTCDACGGDGCNPVTSNCNSGQQYWSDTCHWQCNSGNWGECSKTCGGGTRTNECGSSESCNTQECCNPDCSCAVALCPGMTCGNGCGGSCNGSKTILPGTWSVWSGCPKNCGESETRTCTPGQCSGDCSTVDGGNSIRICAMTAATTPGTVTIVAPNGVDAGNAPVVNQPTTLSWNNNETNHSYTTYYEYQVYDTAGVWIVGNGTSGASAGNASATNMLIGGLTSGHIYYWQVRAVNGSCGGYVAGVTTGPWSTPGYFKINSPPRIDRIVLSDSDDNYVANEVNGIGETFNHICKTGFADSTRPRSVKFRIAVRDPDGIGDSGTITMHWNGHAYGMGWTLSTSAPGIDNVGFTTVDFTGVNTSTALVVTATVRDKWGAEATNNGVPLMYWKPWNCHVPVSGIIYEISNGTVCTPGTALPASPELNYQQTIFTGIDANSVTVAKSSASSYASPPYLTWGEQYLAGLNSDLNGGGITDVRLQGRAVCNSGIQFTIDQSLVDAYIASPVLTADFGSIRNQKPWWQVAGGGVMAKENVSNNVPITCTGTCQRAMVVLGTGVSDDGVVMARSITNNSGCILGQDCSYTNPRNAYRDGAPGHNETTTYHTLLSSLYVNAGVGKTYPDGTSLNTIINDGAKIAFVAGDLQITQNNILAVGDYLIVVVKGDVHILSSVNRVEGVMISDSNMDIDGTSDSQLNINGSLFARGNINVTRGYATAGLNNASPAVKFNYRPDLLFSMPVSVTRVLSGQRIGQ